MTADRSLAAGNAALAAGRWEDARSAFEAALADDTTGEAHAGLAGALWWLGENQASLSTGARAYALARKAGNVGRAVTAAVWLAVTYKANFANHSASNGWLGRAERLLSGMEAGALHGWVAVARAYRMTDLEKAEALTAHALALAEREGDVDLELSAISQLGVIRVARGDTAEGFALIDEAVAVALAGERSTLDTVVYACCDMLTACELAGDIERATQWCQVADEFVATYGCPFLYAECRIYYGSVLVGKGRWDEAERELLAGLRITADASPGLHARALTRLAALRVRQGRLEDASALLDRAEAGVEAEDDLALSVAALQLARGDAGAAARTLEARVAHLAEHRWHLAAALDLLVRAHLDGGEIARAEDAAVRIAGIADAATDDRLRAMEAAARGRVALARNDADAAVALLDDAVSRWSGLQQPFEAATARADLAVALARTDPDGAIDHARRALAAFEALGASLDADRVGALLRQFGLAARPGPRTGARLTEREQEVLNLLGHGLSNPEIGARLHLSRKTVSHHVSNVLAKLGLRNRAEAAAFATANGAVARCSPAGTGARSAHDRDTAH